MVDSHPNLHNASAKMSSRDRAVPILLAIACAVAFTGQVQWRPALFTVEAEIKTDRPALVELRYNRGHGNRQEGITSRVIDKAGEFVRVRFPIETNSAQGLRLINQGAGRSLEIRSLTFNPLGGPARSLTAMDLATNTPNKTETRISGEGEAIHVEWNSLEPLVLHLMPGSRIPATRLAALMQWIFIVPLVLALAGLIMTVRPHPPTRNAGVAAPENSRSRELVVVSLVALYFVASFLKLNGSSTALWRYQAERELPNAGIILGTPKEVRSDEWMLQTPWIFSQARQTPAFSVRNPSVGSDVTPLVTNLPARHWSTLFRPQMWPFFLMETERAFAFYWNFKGFALLLGAFLFFGILTGGKTLLDLAGATLLTFSPFLQWWWSTPTCLPEMLALFFFGLWLCRVLFCDGRRGPIIAAGLGLIVVGVNFALCCYPRFQIPLVYLAAAILAAWWIVERKPATLRAFRGGCLVAVLFVTGLIIYRWWLDVAEIIRVTSLLSYPGQIRFTGGDFGWRRFFDPFLEFSMTGDRYPEQLQNTCEAAGFLFLAPFLLPPVMRQVFRGRPDPLIILPLVLAVFAIVFMACGVPTWVANLSGWAYVYSGRANLLVGTATVIALVRFLSREPEEGTPPRTNIGLFAGWLLILLIVLRITNVQLGHFQSSGTVIATALFFALVAVCLWRGAATATCLLLLIPQFYATALVNPISHGVPGITESRVLKWLAEAHRRKPTGSWIVLGETLRAQVFPDFIKASGAQVKGGMRCNPDYEMLRVLDPLNQYRALTDRYAWVHFKRTDAGTPRIEPAEGLAYDVKIPLDAGLLDQLDIKHILEVDLPGEPAVPDHFHVVDTRDGCRLLERN
ncbi:MAG: hypothetical protein QOE26_672 [Verrucomicrobiota bacterium]|jgi:hypothetical protein